MASTAPRVALGEDPLGELGKRFMDMRCRPRDSDIAPMEVRLRPSPAGLIEVLWGPEGESAPPGPARSRFSLSNLSRALSLKRCIMLVELSGDPEPASREAILVAAFLIGSELVILAVSESYWQ